MTPQFPQIPYSISLTPHTVPQALTSTLLSPVLELTSHISPSPPKLTLTHSSRPQYLSGHCYTVFLQIHQTFCYFHPNGLGCQLKGKGALNLLSQKQETILKGEKDKGKNEGTAREVLTELGSSKKP